MRTKKILCYSLILYASVATHIMMCMEQSYTSTSTTSTIYNIIELHETTDCIKLLSLKPQKSLLEEWTNNNETFFAKGFASGDIMFNHVSFAAHQKAISSVRISPNKNLLISTADNELRIWNTLTLLSRQENNELFHNTNRICAFTYPEKNELFYDNNLLFAFIYPEKIDATIIGNNNLYVASGNTLYIQPLGNLNTVIQEIEIVQRQQTEPEQQKTTTEPIKIELTSENRLYYIVRNVSLLCIGYAILFFHKPINNQTLFMHLWHLVNRIVTAG